MGNKESQPKNMKQLVKETKMSKKDIQEYYKQFMAANPDGQLTRAEFQKAYSQQYPHGDSAAFADNVFSTFDKDGDMKLDFREFMTAIALSQKAAPADQLKWAFEMYDIDGSGQISMAECTHMIKSVIRCYPSGHDLDTQARELTEKIFANIDKNKDGKLSMKEFVDGANHDRTLLTMLEGKPMMLI